MKRLFLVFILFLFTYLLFSQDYYDKEQIKNLKIEEDLRLYKDNKNSSIMMMFFGTSVHVLTLMHSDNIDVQKPMHIFAFSVNIIGVVRYGVNEIKHKRKNVKYKNY